MSRVKIGAFLRGVNWALCQDELGEMTVAQFEDAAHQMYPDSPLDNVREIVIAHLKRERLDGLYNCGWGCACSLKRLETWQHASCEYFMDCSPGILVDGKIVAKEARDEPA